ncbi:MAG: hypothetical protein ACLTUL_03100 [Blautia faecis]
MKFVPLGCYDRILLKIGKILKMANRRMQENKGFSGVDFPIKLIFYGDGFVGKLIGVYLGFLTVRSPEENVPWAEMLT